MKSPGENEGPKFGKLLPFRDFMRARVLNELIGSLEAAGTADEATIRDKIKQKRRHTWKGVGKTLGLAAVFSGLGVLVVKSAEREPQYPEAASAPAEAVPSETAIPDEVAEGKAKLDQLISQGSEISGKLTRYRNTAFNGSVEDQRANLRWIATYSANNDVLYLLLAGDGSKERPQFAKDLLRFYQNHGEPNLLGAKPNVEDKERFLVNDMGLYRDAEEWWHVVHSVPFYDAKTAILFVNKPRGSINSSDDSSLALGIAVNDAYTAMKTGKVDYMSENIADMARIAGGIAAEKYEGMMKAEITALLEKLDENMSEAAIVRALQEYFIEALNERLDEGGIVDYKLYLTIRVMLARGEVKSEKLREKLVKIVQNPTISRADLNFEGLSPDKDITAEEIFKRGGWPAEEAARIDRFLKKPNSNNGRSVASLLMTGVTLEMAAKGKFDRMGGLVKFFKEKGKVFLMTGRKGDPEIEKGRAKRENDEFDIEMCLDVPGVPSLHWAMEREIPYYDKERNTLYHHFNPGRDVPLLRQAMLVLAVQEAQEAVGGAESGTKPETEKLSLNDIMTMHSHDLVRPATAFVEEARKLGGRASESIVLTTLIYVIKMGGIEGYSDTDLNKIDQNPRMVDVFALLTLKLLMQMEDPALWKLQTHIKELAEHPERIKF